MLVPSDAETVSGTHAGDSMDDPAIWVNHASPAQSLLIANDKRGALETYNLDGSLVQRLAPDSSSWGNVDVRQDVADRRLLRTWSPSCTRACASTASTTARGSWHRSTTPCWPRGW